MLPRNTDMLSWSLEEVDAAFKGFCRELGSEEAAKTLMTELLELQVERANNQMKEDILRN